MDFRIAETVDAVLVSNTNAMGIEAVYIDKDANIRDFKRDLMIGKMFYH